MSVPRLRAPVVLVHGLLGFDQLRLGRWVLADYFHGLPEALRAAGNRVLVARVSPTGGIATRAAQLKKFLDRQFPSEPVHLFGHSMGGLDARYLIARLGMAPRVLSLTTLGTPHRGSPLADWGVRRLERLAKPVLDLLGVPPGAFYDLTTARCRAFNEQTPDAPGVRYFSVAGRYEGRWDNPAWLLSAPLIARAEGINDGLVSLASARYGEGCEVWEADHLNLAGWCAPWDRGRPAALTRYAALLGRLRDEGF
jgi:triacylglycerol lipase